jgi:Cyclic nucleotide-binding domain
VSRTTGEPAEVLREGGSIKVHGTVDHGLTISTLRMPGNSLAKDLPGLIYQQRAQGNDFWLRAATSTSFLTIGTIRFEGEVPHIFAGGVTKTKMNSRNKNSKSVSEEKGGFNAQAFLDSAGVARKIVKFRRSEKIYSQGDPTKGVKYIQEGGVKLSVVNEVGKEAVVAILGPGDFFLVRDAWPVSRFVLRRPPQWCPRQSYSLKKMR